VKEFNLSWEEIVKLGRNSLQYSFLDEPTKQRLLANYDKRIAAFALPFQKGDWQKRDWQKHGRQEQGGASLGNSKPVSYGFLCRHYQICLLP
jgi:adenosine deaminase CECR1